MKFSVNFFLSATGLFERFRIFVIELMIFTQFLQLFFFYNFQLKIMFAFLALRNQLTKVINTEALQLF